ncbi:hypothetical protein OIU78_000159 [Salix suchowensis]|nr:hypothetical protein OIU78_000159 [Salix suchowensis]
MDVIFEPQTGLPFSIEVGFFDTVLEIKEKVEKYHGIPKNKQTLVFHGQLLQDEKDVGSCEILQNSRIQLLVAREPDEKPQVPVEETPPSKKVQLNIKIPSNQTPVPLEMDMSDTVLHLKEKIHEMEPVPVKRLVLQSNGSIGGSAGLKKLRVIVLTRCGTKRIPIEVNPSDNVEVLRKELHILQHQMQFQLPQEGYFFIHKQDVMDDDRSFRWHRVKQGDIIEIFNGRVTSGS